MASIPLRIILQGLMALVPTTDPAGVNHMTALLVDGRMAHAAECPLEHHPALSFLARRSAECIQANCTAIGNECRCPENVLVRKQITLGFNPEVNFETQRPNNSPVKGLPANRDEAADFSYVANLSQAPFGLTLNPDYLTNHPAANLLARMVVPLQAVTACALAAREDAGESFAHSMSFRKLHDPSTKTDMNQALAQLVIVQLDVPADGTEVSLHVSDLDGGNDQAIALLPGSRGYKIDLSNQPRELLDRDDPCNDGVARHFAMFYDLAQGVVAPSKRLLPHVRFTQSKSLDELKPVICDERFLGFMDRPMCPMATFNP